MEIKSKINLSLVWKKTNIAYKFLKNNNYNVPEDVANYLISSYKDGFETLKMKIVQAPIVSSVSNQKIELEAEQNGLYELIEMDTKQVIEKALEKQVIIKKGIWFFFENEIVSKGINNLLKKLQEEQDLRQKILNKIKE